MNKGLKVLSAVLTMSMVLASGVFAVDAEWDKDQLNLLKEYGFALPTETKEVKKDVLYKELVDDNFKASLKEYDKALKTLTSDAKTIQALGDARCQAQFDLDSANNEILASRKLMELAKGIGHIDEDYTVQTAWYNKEKKEYQVDQTDMTINNDNEFFAQDLAELKKLIKVNKELSSMSATDLAKKPLSFFVESDKDYGQLLMDNKKAIDKFFKKTEAPAYDALLNKVKTRFGANEKLHKTAEQVTDQTVSELTTKAKVATAKINLINDLAEKYKVTLRACSLADYTAKVPSKAAAKKDAAKKDDVPNTASYFTIYVPTCEFAAPAVKYYGSAQVYEKALRRPLVCKKVETKTVEVPRFTFDELTAYDVACCCCK